ncbi:unnamed protein product [Caenorhabditis angaria]|uniref:Uncharacterized protein n=1 Tax=Caenorhabditis angaria TaxID=860376 RepID=A0A9P1N6L2_9PELO|nr:unnamed protein product [Caenorhabditis angaria]
MSFFSILDDRRRYLRYPKELFENLESKFYSNPPTQTEHHDGWVTARFSLEEEHILFLGDDPGNIGIYNVEKLYDNAVPIEEKQLHFFPAHDGAIMDIVGVPNKSSSIVSISGDCTIRCWDLNQHNDNRSSDLFQGHEGSVRSLNFAPDDSNIFVSGARDGQVKIWDMRVSAVRKNDKLSRNSTITYKSAHPSQQAPHEKAATPKSKQSKQKPSAGVSVTSVLFLNDFTIASASSNAETGIRIWDIRKPGDSHPCQILKIPVTSSRKAGFGVTSLAIDRFRSSLFASCTNSIVYEYCTQTTSCSPLRAYSGAIIRDYYTQIACSPISDTIACGSDDKRAVIWDVQDQYVYRNDIFGDVNEAEKRRALLPKWSLEGHEGRVSCVGWSANAKYFMSLDDRGLRIWNEAEKCKCCDDDISEDTQMVEENRGIHHESAQPYKMTCSDDAISKIDSMCLAPRPRANSTIYQSPQKPRVSKRPLNTSPFKLSPQAKICKVSSSPFKPLNYLNEEKTPKHKKKKTAPYFYRYPTENLPNFVYDQFVKSLIGGDNKPSCSSKSLSKTSKKRIDDWWTSSATSENKASITPGRIRLPSVSEFGESACAKVISEEERNALLSPKKLVIISKNPISASKNDDSPRTSTRTPTEQKRRTSRNLLHYFNKKS